MIVIEMIVIEMIVIEMMVKTALEEALGVGVKFVIANLSLLITKTLIF